MQRTFVEGKNGGSSDGKDAGKDGAKKDDGKAGLNPTAASFSLRVDADEWKPSFETPSFVPAPAAAMVPGMAMPPMQQRPPVFNPAMGGMPPAMSGMPPPNPGMVMNPAAMYIPQNGMMPMMNPGMMGGRMPNNMMGGRMPNNMAN